MPDLASVTGSAITPRKKATHFVPTIVFHGDADHTVGQRNAASIVQQAAETLSTHDDEGAANAVTERGVAPRGRGYTRTRYSDAHGVPRVESWVLHGAGHAWAGGNARGSYTDATGPDAAAEMVRFFLARPQAGSA
jgi:poly(3-hydroxybutyrate) depolymerase